MAEVHKEILLSKKREYYKRSKIVRECPSNAAVISPDKTTQHPNSTTTNLTSSYQLTKCTDPVEAPPTMNNTANYTSAEPSPDNGQTTQNLQSNIHNPTLTTILTLLSYTDLVIFLGGNDQTDDPYGIFEPIVHDTNFDGTFIYYCSRCKFVAN
jgi:hypothetical protein